MPPSIRYNNLRRKNEDICPIVYNRIITNSESFKKQLTTKD